MRRYLIPLVVFVLVAALFATGLHVDDRPPPSAVIGKPVPAFALPQLHVPEQVLTDEVLRGKVVLVNVWASWCAGCQMEHPVLMKLYQHGRLPIFGINYKDAPGDARAWLARFGDPYAATVADRDGRTGTKWGAYGVPETFLVDARGVIRYRHIGPLTEEVWREELEPLVRKFEQRR